MDNSESFRNDLSVKLASVLTPEQLHNVLSAVDLTAADYDISRRETGLIVVGQPPVVSWYLASKNVENMAQGTIYRYQRALYHFFNFVKRPVQEITANDVRAYLSSYKQTNNVSNSTLDNTRRVLNAFFTWLVANDYLMKNPVAKVSKIKYTQAKRVALNPYQLEQLRYNCRTEKERALIEIFYSTGCRVSEVAAMKLSDINWHDRSIVINHGKGDKARTVFFSFRAEFLLKKYFATRNDNYDAMFIGERVHDPDGNLRARSLQNIIKNIRSREPIGAKCTPHILRHTMATAGLRQGIPLPELQTLLGHAKPETTMIYAHLNLSDIHQTYSKVFA